MAQENITFKKKILFRIWSEDCSKLFLLMISTHKIRNYFLLNPIYFGLCQSTHMVSEKFKQFVTYLRRQCVTNKCDAATFCARFMVQNQTQNAN